MSSFDNRVRIELSDGEHLWPPRFDSDPWPLYTAPTRLPDCPIDLYTRFQFMIAAIAHNEQRCGEMGIHFFADFFSNVTILFIVNYPIYP